MSIRDNQTHVRHLFEEVFNNGNYDIVDEFVADDYVDLSPIPAPAQGPQKFKMRTQMLHAAVVREVAFGPFLAERDLVAFTWTLGGVHNGPFVGNAPTGKMITLSGINVEHMADGQIVEHWSQFNLVGLLRQMGETSLPHPGGGK